MSFLERWSRRKQDVKEGRPVEPEPLPAVAPDSLPAVPAVASDVQARNVTGPDVIAPNMTAQADAAPANAARGENPASPEDIAKPTLEDAQALAPGADIRRFVGADVPADVKNTALKKLFADPRFNIQDGLDVYIDDYSKPDPIPPSMLRQLASAQFLDLFDEKKKAREAADAAAADSVAESDRHADPDLRLQQDDAPGPEGSGDEPR